MNKGLVYSLFLLLLTCAALDAAPAQQQQHPQGPTIQQALYQEILIQEDRAAFYLTQMQINPDLSGKFREAEKMLEVKEVLYRNLANSPALNNPYIANFLLKIMAQESIAADQLIALQKMINAELHRE